MRAQTSKPRTVDEYLAAIPIADRRTLQGLRRTIRAAAPGATEAISYGIPAYKQDGNLVSFAAFKNHLTLFAGAAINKDFAGPLKGFERTKGGIHFTPQNPIPSTLVTRIVKARLKENEARTKRKKK